MKRILQYTIFFLLLFINAQAANSKSCFKYHLSICAIFRDEAPYLKEWIEFHRMVGVEHFYLVNHLSEDDYLAVLNPYINSGVVTLHECHTEIGEVPWGEIQRNAYNHFLPLTKKETKWLAIIDTDEFIVPVQKDSLVRLLQEYDHYAGLGINWQMYGTSGVDRIREGELMIEKLLIKANKSFGGNTHLKCIVKPYLVSHITPHYCHFKKNCFAVDENKQELPTKGRSAKVNIEKIRINHYWTRDEHFFYHNKIPRRIKMNGAHEYADALKRNEWFSKAYDDIMLRFIPKLHQRMQLVSSRKHSFL